MREREQAAEEMSKDGHESSQPPPPLRHTVDVLLSSSP
jgi:hypothetical protein